MSSVDKYTDNGRQFTFGRRSSKRPDHTVHQQLQNSQKKPRKNQEKTAWHKHWLWEMANFQLTAAAHHSGAEELQEAGMCSRTYGTHMAAASLNLWHIWPGMVRPAPHSTARPKQTSPPLPLCYLFFPPLVTYIISQHLLEHFLTNSAAKKRSR